MGSTPTLETYEALIERCYESVLDASRWSGLLASLVAASGRQCGAMAVGNPGRAQATVMASVECDPAAVQAYNDRYGKIDPVRPWIASHEAGQWCHDKRDLGNEVVANHPYYREFQLAYGFDDRASIQLSTEGTPVYLALLTAIGVQPETVHDELLVRIAPHLKRAGRMFQAMAPPAREPGPAEPPARQPPHAAVAARRRTAGDVPQRRSRTLQRPSGRRAGRTRGAARAPACPDRTPGPGHRGRPGPNRAGARNAHRPVVSRRCGNTRLPAAGRSPRESASAAAGRRQRPGCRAASATGGRTVPVQPRRVTASRAIASRMQPGRICAKPRRRVEHGPHAVARTLCQDRHAPARGTRQPAAPAVGALSVCPLTILAG